jgi:hypothetical protein
MATLFRVSGPHRIPVERGVSGVYIRPRCPEFWDQAPDLESEKGCYLFAIQAAKGHIPIYVGKATRSFGQECFESHKVACHYTPALANRRKGTPVLFFLVVAAKRGRVNLRSIRDLELELIRIARQKNPHLSNVQNNKDYTWDIVGVTQGRGKASKSASIFKKAISW